MTVARRHLDAALEAAGVPVPRTRPAAMVQTAGQATVQAAHRVHRRVPTEPSDRAGDDTLDALSLQVNTLYTLQDTRPMTALVLRAAPAGRVGEHPR